MVRYGDSTSPRTVIKLLASYVHQNDTNVPLILNFNFGAAYRTDGLDIVVTTAAGALVPRTVSPKGDGTYAIYFREPAQTTSGGGTTLFVQWGGSTVNVANDLTTWQNCHGSTDDYVLVVHGEETSANLADESGNITLTDSNVSYSQTGKIIKCPYFNGTDANSITNSSIQARSLYCWVYVKDKSISQKILSQREVDVGNIRQTISVMSGRLGVSFYVGSGLYNHRSMAINNDTWYHVAVKNDGATANTIKLYINGVEETDTTHVLSTASSVGFALGSGIDDSNFFDGYIDEVRGFRGQLTENQCKTQYDNQRLFDTNGSFNISIGTNIHYNRRRFK